MTQQIDAKYVKENIIKFLNEKGPSLPIPIAKHVGLNTLFTSAFLAELSGEGLVKISDMKVGGSPLYYVEGTQNLLENFVNYLNQKEREACTLLKEKNILEDINQHPAIRVALRGLKDFAIPYKENDKIMWRYFNFKEQIIPKKEIIKIDEKQEVIKTEIKPPETLELKESKTGEVEKLKQINQEIETKQKELEIIKQQLTENLNAKKKMIKEKNSKKENPENKFLNEVQSYLEKNNIGIIEINPLNKKEILGKIKIGEVLVFLGAFDKKRLEEEDIIKIYKKAVEANLQYQILFRGELPKKTKEFIEAYKKLIGIGKIE